MSAPTWTEAGGVALGLVVVVGLFWSARRSWLAGREKEKRR